MVLCSIVTLQTLQNTVFFSTGTPEVYKEQVVRGNDLIMTCDSERSVDSVGKPLWKFNRMVLLAESINPYGYENVDGNMVNNTIAFLRIVYFSPINIGNYTCVIGYNETATYLLDIVGLYSHFPR